MDKSPKQNNPELKSKIISIDADEEREYFADEKYKTNEELKSSLERLKEQMDLLDMERKEKNEYIKNQDIDLGESKEYKEELKYFAERIDKINQSIQDIHNYTAKLDLDSYAIEDELKEIEILEKKYRAYLLNINHSRLN